MFLPEEVENGPAGLDARLALRPNIEDTFEEIFELFPKGEPFEVYIRNWWSRRSRLDLVETCDGVVAVSELELQPLISDVVEETRNSIRDGRGGDQSPI